MSTKNVDTISPAQCRGARGLLEMTQLELAKAASLGISTIVDFEKSRRPVSIESILKIRDALQKAGIQFIPDNGGGRGVRFRKTGKR